MIMRTFPVIAAAFCFVALAETPVLDRGLAKANLNDNAGVARSNVRWSWYAHGFVGDDLRVGAPGERWVIDRIRIWAVPATPDADPNTLGEFFQDVRLYFGRDDLSPVMAGRFEPGAEQTDNERIRIRETREASLYEEFGQFYRVWQIDFTGLDLKVDGGETYRFGAWGLGRSITGKEGKAYSWFTLGWNAPLSESSQEGADGTLLTFDSAGRYDGSFDSTGKAWNKPSDLNVQVFARRVPARTR